MSYLVLLTPAGALALLVALARVEEWSLRNHPDAGPGAARRRRGGARW